MTKLRETNERLVIEMFVVHNGFDLASIGILPKPCASGYLLFLFHYDLLPASCSLRGDVAD
jgi:hypothetical protein